jgi:hypothetical protein
MFHVRTEYLRLSYSRRKANMLSSFNEPLKSMAAQDEILLHTFGDFQRRRLVDFPFKIILIFCVVLYPYEDFGEKDNAQVYSQFVIHIHTSFVFSRIVSKR